MHRHHCSRPGLVQLRLLALRNQTRDSTFRTGRDDRSQKFTARFSHRFRSGRLVEEFLRDRLDLTRAEGFRLAG
jgi:hypothetical protein